MEHEQVFKSSYLSYGTSGLYRQIEKEAATVENKLLEETMK